MNLLILGAGQHGRVVKEIAEATGSFAQIAYLDDKAADAIGTLSAYERFADTFSCAFVAMGDPEIRSALSEQLRAAGYTLPVLIHPSAYVSPSASLGAGTIVMPQAVIQAYVTIGCGGIVSAGALIDHNATVGAYCHINAGAIIPARETVPDATKVDYGVIYRNVE